MSYSNIHKHRTLRWLEFLFLFLLCVCYVLHIYNSNKNYTENLYAMTWYTKYTNNYDTKKKRKQNLENRRKTIFNAFFTKPNDHNWINVHFHFHVFFFCKEHNKNCRKTIIIIIVNNSNEYNEVWIEMNTTIWYDNVCFIWALCLLLMIPPAIPYMVIHTSNVYNERMRRIKCKLLV